jgi:hypothetical protein
MAHDPNSPEVILSDWYERDVAERARRHGWYVLHTAAIGEGATMVEGPDGARLPMPDLQLFDLIRGRKSRLVEVKVKRGAYIFQITGIARTGIDWPKWEFYRRINAGGVPVDLAFIHLHWPLRTSQLAPKLLWQSLDALSKRGPVRFNSPRFPGGAAVWDVRDFDVLGDLPNPPAHILAALQACRWTPRIWETPPKLRPPRSMPGQFDLFR